jgi:hypothetical protein
VQGRDDRRQAGQPLDRLVTLKLVPRRACAAVAPRQTIRLGLSDSISEWSQGRRARISVSVGFLCSRILPHGFPLEMLDSIGDVDGPAIDRAVCRRRRRDVARGLLYRGAVRRPSSPRHRIDRGCPVFRSLQRPPGSRAGKGRSLGAAERPGAGPRAIAPGERRARHLLHYVEL